MHIVIVTTTNDRSETYCWQQFAARGAHVSVVGHDDAPERAALENAGISYIPLRIRHRLDLRSVRALRKAFTARPPDVIYAPRNGCLSVALMAAGRCPVVGYRGTIGHLSHWDPAAWLTYLNPRLAHIISVSDAVRTYLSSMRISDQKTTTIYKGHDIAWYDAPPSGTRTDIGIPENAFSIGFTGSVRPVKGVDVLIRAMTHLPTDTHLAVVGELREQHLPELVNALGLSRRVTFVGHRTDAVHLMKHFDAFVMPSLEREGLPRAVIEAMAQERAVVVSNVGGLPELVPDGECGYVVPPGDPKALAEKLNTLYASPDRAVEMGKAAQGRIATHFNIESTVDAMLALFERLSGARP